MTVAVAKASHLFSLSCSDPWKRIRRAALKDNIGTQLALHLLHHPAPPLLSAIIFFFWKKAKNMFDRPLFIRGEPRLRSFFAGPFSHRRRRLPRSAAPRFCRTAPGKRRSVAQGLRCGTWWENGPWPARPPRSVGSFSTGRLALKPPSSFVGETGRRVH